MPNTVHNIFDLLHVDGRDTRALPLIWRKRLLRNSFQFSDALRYTTHRVRDGQTAYRATCERGDEGVIAKLAEAAYEGKRSTKWLKLGLGALLIGYHDGVDLVYAGKSAPASIPATLRSLHKRLARTEQDASPITCGQVREPGVHWVCPTLVAQVAFSEWTREGKLRHPRYLGLRMDKSPAEVVRETR